MTVEQLYLSALACVPSNISEDDSLRQYMPLWVNLLLRETLKYQNCYLAVNGDDELKQAPSVTDMQDEIPYAQELVENAFVWGIASFMAKDDDDFTHEQDYRGRYISACVEYTPLVQGGIEDFYGEDEDECRS